MQSLSFHEFQSHVGSSIEQVLSTHTPLRVFGTPGNDVVVMRAEDWEQVQETLYVLQNQSLNGLTSSELAQK
jgi:antitoxin YefM